MQAKPVQIAVIVIGLLVGVVGIVLAVSKGSSPKTAPSVVLLDLATGDIYEASTTNRTLVMPAKSPDTGERTLMRVHFDEELDAYAIPTRYFSMLEDIEGSTVEIDMQTGKVDIDISQDMKKLP